MTARATQVGALGAIIDGRVRDLPEIEGMKFPVWAKGKSTMGAAPFCKLAEVGRPINLCDDTIFPVIVKTGDIIFADKEGVVRIPQTMVEQVIEKCKIRTAIDQKCMDSINQGNTIIETFAKFR